jgi:hypothetical protein
MSDHEQEALEITKFSGPKPASTKAERAAQ